jgi:hypothetical protein
MLYRPARFAGYDFLPWSLRMMNESTPPADWDTPPASKADAPAASSGSGVSSVAGAVRRTRKPRLDPYGLRVLIISWCLWLLMSWSITLAIGATVHAVRWVVFSAMFGLMAVWPALRLSQQLPGRHAGLIPDSSGRIDYGVASSRSRVLATMLDWVCLLLVFQVVVWPLMLVGRWSVQQTFWLDLAVVSWSLLTAVVIGFGRVLPLSERSRGVRVSGVSGGSGVRVAAMLVCVLLLVGEPVWMAIGGVGFDTAGVEAVGGAVHAPLQMRISPLQTLWELTTTVQPYDPSTWRLTILSTAAAALLGVFVLVGMGLWGGREPRPDNASRG